jgi:hypothetical protein
VRPIVVRRGDPPSLKLRRTSQRIRGVSHRRDPSAGYQLCGSSEKVLCSDCRRELSKNNTNPATKTVVEGFEPTTYQIFVSGSAWSTIDKSEICKELQKLAAPVNRQFRQSLRCMWWLIRAKDMWHEFSMLDSPDRSVHLKSWPVGKSLWEEICLNHSF